MWDGSSKLVQGLPHLSSLPENVPVDPALLTGLTHTARHCSPVEV